MKKEKICGIYKITSPSGSVYVGQSNNILNRWHIYERNICNNIILRQPKLERSFKKYGVGVHKFEILESCVEENLNEREIYWISFLNTYKKGMNCSLGGDGGRGIKWSTQSRTKSSNSRKGKMTGKDNPNFGNGDKLRGKNSPMFGVKKTEENKEKNRNSNRETWSKIVKSDWYNSEEQKQKRNSYNKGRKRTESAIINTRLSNKNTWAKIIQSAEFNSEEQKKIRSERMKRAAITRKNNPNYNSEEQKLKRSVKQKDAWGKLRESGFKHSASTREKMSISAKNRRKN